MPMKPITVRRWEIAAAFVLFVISLVISVELSYRHANHRIDQAEKRITANRASVIDLEKTNRRQDAIRRLLVKQGRATSIRICQETEKIKARIRSVVHVDRAEFLKTLTQLNINPNSSRGIALFNQARKNAQQTLHRFAPTNCRHLTFKPKN